MPDTPTRETPADPKTAESAPSTKVVVPAWVADDPFSSGLRPPQCDSGARAASAASGSIDSSPLTPPRDSDVPKGASAPEETRGADEVRTAIQTPRDTNDPTSRTGPKSTKGPPQTRVGSAPPPNAGRSKRWPRWLLLGALALAASVVGLFILDAGNASTFRLHCTPTGVTLERARRLPWPFGFEPVADGPSAQLHKDTRCENRTFEQRAAAEVAFLTLVLIGAEQGLSLPSKALPSEIVSRQLDLAIKLAIAHDRSAEVVRLHNARADISYREGLQRLTFAETNLRQGLRLLRQAQTLGRNRYERLGPWLALLRNAAAALTPTAASLAEQPAALAGRRIRKGPSGPSPFGHQHLAPSSRPTLAPERPSPPRRRDPTAVPAPNPADDTKVQRAPSPPAPNRSLVDESPKSPPAAGPSQGPRPTPKAVPEPEEGILL